MITPWNWIRINSYINMKLGLEPRKQEGNVGGVDKNKSGTPSKTRVDQKCAPRRAHHISVHTIRVPFYLFFFFFVSITHLVQWLQSGDAIGDLPKFKKKKKSQPAKPRMGYVQSSIVYVQPSEWGDLSFFFFFFF